MNRRVVDGSFGAGQEPSPLPLPSFLFAVKRSSILHRRFFLIVFMVWKIIQRRKNVQASDLFETIQSKRCCFNFTLALGSTIGWRPEIWTGNFASNVLFSWLQGRADRRLCAGYNSRDVQGEFKGWTIFISAKLFWAIATMKGRGTTHDKLQRHWCAWTAGVLEDRWTGDES